MKIIKTEGCIAGNITFDGKSWIDFSRQEKRNILTHLLAELEGRIFSGEINIQELMNVFEEDSCENDGLVCDQCGDTVTTTIWNI